MNTKDLTINEYAAQFASRAPVPGGGGVSSIVGSFAAAAGEMVCSLTVGKKKYASIEPEVRGIAKRLKETREKLIELADKDAEVFEPLAAAYNDKARTDAELDTLYANAAGAPLEVMRAVYSILDEIQYLSENGSSLAVSDAACAAVYARAAISGELLNVKINTRCMKDAELRKEIESEADAIYKTGQQLCDKIFADVLEKLK